MGKGSNNRFLKHMRKSKLDCNNHKNNKIRKIIKETGSDPKIIVFTNSLLEKEALELEIKLIKAIGRNDLKKGPLLNFTDGGDGVAGYRHSEENKKKFSLLSKGNKNCLGRIMTKESKKKMSETKKRKHIHLSEERKRQIGEFHNYELAISCTVRTNCLRDTVKEAHKVMCEL